MRDWLRVCVAALWVVGAGSAMANFYHRIDCGATDNSASQKLVCQDVAVRMHYGAMIRNFESGLIRSGAQAESLRINQREWDNRLLESCSDQACFVEQIQARSKALVDHFSYQRQPRPREDAATERERIAAEMAERKKIESDNRAASQRQFEVDYARRNAAMDEARRQREQQVAQRQAVADTQYVELEIQQKTQREAERQQAEAIELSRKEQFERDRAARELQQNQAREQAVVRAAEVKVAAEKQAKENEEKRVAMQRSNSIQSWTMSIVFITLAVNAVVAILRSRRGTMVLFTSYTDLAMTVAAPILVFVAHIVTKE